ncbi:MAG: ABC transporter ATP-binding protein [Cyanophyceae cyanobacterium]
MRLSTENLTLTYGDRAILENINVAFPPGKISVLVGPNGCGKSTLLRSLARLLKPKTGTVYLDGHAIAKLPPQELARRQGILPQSPTAPEGLTVRDLVAQGRYPHQTWWRQWSAEDEQWVETAIALTHLEALAHRDVTTLSGGQRQRAWIAILLAQNPSLFLLDEPTTYLDLAHQIEILDLLRDLNQRLGKTIIMVLHDLNQACRYGDWMTVLRLGQIYASGAPQTVVTETMMRDVFALESHIMADPVSGMPLCIPIGPLGATAPAMPRTRPWGNRVVG